MFIESGEAIYRLESQKRSFTRARVTATLTLPSAKQADLDDLKDLVFRLGGEGRDAWDAWFEH